MKRMIQAIVVVAVAVMIIVPTVSAQPSKTHGMMNEQAMCPPSPHEQAVDGIFKELNLTTEQKNKLKQNRRAQRDKIEDLQAELKEKHAELASKLNDPDVSRAMVEPIATELKSLHAKIIDSRIDGIFAVKEILTPEQYAKFQEKVKEKVENRKEQRGQWKKQRRSTGK